MTKVLFASQNQGKLKEFNSLLGDLDIELIHPKQIGLSLSVVEDGKTYLENATKKAKNFAEASGLITLADDSGLEVDALDGKPGLFSARFSPQPGATDADRRGYLLQKLRAIPQPWTAQFRCLIALVDQTGGSQFAEGICPGQIIPEERGTHGFGYDPIFLVSSMERTMAELTMEEKNRLSHRALALKIIRPMLIALLSYD